jgi:type I restriction enzyme M protein
VEDLAQTTREHPQVKKFGKKFTAALADFNPWLRCSLLEKMLTLQVPRQESLLSEELFARLAPLPLIDRYHAYQILDDHWQPVAIDLEILQTEGFKAGRVVEPNIIEKTSKGEKVEVQDGWKGRILPFALVQSIHHHPELEALRAKETRLGEISASLEDIITTLSESDGEYRVLNDSNDKFSVTETKSKLSAQLQAVETDEIVTLRAYLGLLARKAKKPEKIAFINAHPEIDWKQMPTSKDGTVAKGIVDGVILAIQCAFDFPEDSFAGKLITVSSLLDEEKRLKTAIKQEADALHMKTKETIENLSDSQVHELLELKWITPLSDELHRLPGQQMDRLTRKLEALVEKYRLTYADNAREIQQTETALVGMIEELDANQFDLKGLAELKTLLAGD